MDKPDAAYGAGAGDVAGTVGVDRLGEIALALAAVDVGEGSGVDHGIGPGLFEDTLDVGGIRDVHPPERKIAQVVIGALAAGSAERLVGVLGEQALQHFRSEQPVAAGDQDAHGVRRSCP